MPSPKTLPGAARARRLESGAAWVTLLLLLAVVAACYLGVVWLPIWADHYEVKQVTRDFMNQAVKNRNDASLIAGLSRRLSGVRILKGVDEDGRRWEAAAVDVAPEDITWERDLEADPPMIHVAFEYEREIEYPLLDRVTTATFVVDLEQDIEMPVWEPKR